MNAAGVALKPQTGPGATARRVGALIRRHAQRRRGAAAVLLDRRARHARWTTFVLRTPVFALGTARRAHSATSSAPAPTACPSRGAASRPRATSRKTCSMSARP